MQSTILEATDREIVRETCETVRPTVMIPASKTPSVPALERGLAILELIAQSRGGLTFSQLAQKLRGQGDGMYYI